ncbi:hypothetical protein A2368_03370 [Candidatus Collierbacteria bacterium RIFOXYB1_FULL_49_13]|uniref:Uncharacterized protein n=1 Tax=Candidatus Collierbacteria bacterium RIFOXYB1_FULL_49_13 TaxID=1817728 RepID=A0A1F5FJ66_9BACT|nr:MAG: hypothetical protein A2368_03370 [Candidatus Collierbacteria bacterium RIFOXYB1_FULL_49_13]
MSKRSKFVLVAVILSVLMWLLEYLAVDSRIQAVVAVVVFSYVICGWALFEDLKGIEWVTILMLPVLYTLGAGLFSFFLPSHIARLGDIRLEADVARLLADVIRMGFWAIYGIGMYTVMLMENILSVASVKTIQLLRAAHTAGFIMTLVVGLFLYNSVFSFKLAWWLNGLLVFGLTFPIVLQAIWYMELREYIDKKVLMFVFVISLIMGELAVVMSFWPARAIMTALFLTTALYVMVGTAQQYVIGRLFQKQVYDYVGIAAMVTTITILFTSWR